MTLVSGKIRFMWIMVGLIPWKGGATVLALAVQHEVKYKKA